MYDLHSRKRSSQANIGDSAAAIQQPQRLDLDAFAGERRKTTNRAMKFSFAAISLFLATAGLFCYLAVHHQHRRVILKVIQDPWSHASPLLRNSQVGFHHFLRSGPPRYVTVVMPSVVNPKKRTRRLESIADTWGPLANAVYVVHNVSEFPQSSHQVYYKEQHPADPYAYPQLLLVPPHITVSDGLPRLNYVIRSIFEKINPDFAFFVNDHTYVIPEHICRFLHKRDPTVSIYAGHALKNHKEAFNSGAAGYFLSRKSMSLLVKSWDEERDDCVVKDDNKWLQGNPGIVTARCLHHQLETPALDTREKGKWHRFHAFGIVGVVKGKVDGWYLNKHEDLENILGFDPSYSKLLEGEGCCSKETISFHYVEFKETRALFSVRQALLKNPQMTDQQLQDLMMQEWPTEWNELGGYSKPLPKKESTDEWKPLLAVVRKISSRHTQMDC